MEAALVVARLGQYLAVSGVFGGTLFFARQPAGPTASTEQGLLLGSGVLLIASTLADLVLQVASMADPGAGAPMIDPAVIGQVLTGTAFGSAVAIRLGVAVAVLLLLGVSPPGRRLWAASALGAVATLTLAWGGHGAADEGAAGVVHLVADLLHLLAAALWIGALGALVVMAADRRAGAEPAVQQRLHGALEGFSGAGTIAVAVLILTGLVNSWFLIGPTHLSALFTTLYGRLLVAKLALFAIMAVLAAANRWRLTPTLGVATGAGPARAAISVLRRSVALETSVAVLVLAAVAWLGTLAPPAAI